VLRALGKPWIRNAFILLAVALLVASLGKDLNWDQYNYHLYIAHAFLHDRFGMDVMPAATNSFLNPIPYLPFYWMAMAEWPSLTIALIIGSCHALGLVLLWELCERFLFHGSRSKRSLTGWSVGLAACTPVWLGLVGGTFIEPTTFVLTVAALLLAMFSLATDAPPRANLLLFSAGVALGIATGFKLTGIVFAAGLGFSLLASTVYTRVIGACLAYSAGLATGFLASYGWLGARLWSEFSNPFFPFMNGYFRSPDFILENLTHDRFAFNSFVELLQLPFNMTTYHPWMYVEKLSPDIRPAALTIGGVLLALTTLGRCVYRLYQHKKTLAPCPEDQTSTANKLPTVAARLMWLFFAFSLVFWLITSANGRYGLPILMLIGPLLVWTLSRLTKNSRVINYLLLLVVGWQALQQYSAWPPRWDTTDWTPTWYAPQIPERFRTKSFGYLSVGSTHTNSFIVPFLHPQSGFASISGNTWNFAPNGPGSARFYDFFQRYEGRLRVLYATRRATARVSPNELILLSRPLLAWGLKVDENDCDFLQVNLENYGVAPPQIDLEADTPVLENRYDTRLITCAVTPGGGESAEDKATRAQLEPIFDRIETYCPLLFSPRGWQMSYSKFGWKRHYTKSDIVVYAADDRLTLSRYDYGPFDLRIGRISEWAAGATPFPCERLLKHWQQ
jgi:hypothetical protein